MKTKVYISGAITELPFEAVKAKFDRAETLLLSKGYEVASPLKNGIPFNAPWEIHLAIDAILLAGCDAIYLLPDWEASKGATIERTIAKAGGKRIIYEKAQEFAELKRAIFRGVNIPFYRITGDKRIQQHVYARMIFAHYCRQDGASVREIAGNMNRTESTVSYYLRKFEDELRYNHAFGKMVEKVEYELSVMEHEKL